MKKSINAWTIPAHVGFDEMFAAISAAGFETIELNVDKDGHSAHSLHMETSQEELTDIAALSQKYHLPVCSISSSLYGGTLCSEDADMRKQGQALIRKQIFCARALGAEAILTVPGGINDELSIAQAYENAHATLAEMTEEIAASKVHVGLENVWNNFFASPQDMARFIDRLDCPYIGAYFDVGNVIVNSYPQHWIEILGKRIVRIHVKDFMRMGGYHGAFVNLLEGNARWDLVIPALRKIGYDGPLTAELSAMPQNPDYLYGITVKALERIIQY